MEIRLLISTEDIAFFFFFNNWILSSPVRIRNSHQESEKWYIKSLSMMKFISDFLIFFSSSVYFFPLFTLFSIHKNYVCWILRSKNYNPLQTQVTNSYAMQSHTKSSMWDKSLDAFHICMQWLWGIYLLLFLKISETANFSILWLFSLLFSS